MTLENRAELDFVLTLRRLWANTVYPTLRREFDAQSPTAKMGEEIATIRDLPSYRLFSWLERGSQKMLWRAVTGAVDASPPAAQVDCASTLTLDPALQLPDWYTRCDIHIQPGGVWSSDRNARIYELGAKLVMLGENDDYAFHRLFVDTAIPKRDYARMVDLGCGFGKSTWPLKQRFPDAEVIGVDLSAPCLTLAKERADERQLGIAFIQADATATPIPANSVDLVTATMLIHELPIDELGRLFAEAARFLAPGGLVRILDFQRTGDAFRDYAMVEHGTRNNEPFLPPMMAANLAQMAAAAGLENVRWRAFDERGVGLLPSDQWPQRSEWHFPWAVLEAEKPA